MFTHAIVGLGNPGPRFVCTRHNVGFRLIDRMALANQAQAVSLRADMSLTSIQIEEHRIALIKPLTYMNRSGSVVASFLSRYSVPTDRLLIVYDDVALALGRMRFRSCGSAGSHNGMGDIVEKLQTTEIPRLRLGIGTEMAVDGELAEFVLSDFTVNEQSLVGNVLEIASKAARMWLFESTDYLMSQFNGLAVEV